MKSWILVGVGAAVLLLAQQAGAVNCVTHGKHTYCDDGTRIDRYGNEVLDNHGGRWTTLGDHVYGNDGSWRTRHGDHVVSSLPHEPTTEDRLIDEGLLEHDSAE